MLRAPGKRPRLTPNPALAVKNGEWVMPFGTPGGDVQTQAMLQCLINFAMFGMNPQHAVEAPRFATFSFPSSFAPFECRPNLLQLEGRIERETGDVRSPSAATTSNGGPTAPGRPARCA